MDFGFAVLNRVYSCSHLCPKHVRICPKLSGYGIMNRETLTLMFNGCLFSLSVERQ